MPNPDDSNFEAEANLDHGIGVSTECLNGRCANCWNDDCRCNLCNHSGTSDSYRAWISSR